MPQGNGDPRQLRLTASQRSTVDRWLAYKLAQAESALGHYASQYAQRGDEADLSAWSHWRGVVRSIDWIAPGGRGLARADRPTAE